MNPSLSISYTWNATEKKTKTNKVPSECHIKSQTFELCLFGAFVGERREGADKLGELDFLVLVAVENGQQTAEKRVLVEVGDGLELVAGKGAAAVAIQLLKAPIKPSQLILGD